MKCSLCMIVKNESESIDQCLMKASQYFNDIVIVDTGSSDQTKEICKEYTDRVYDFDWIDDFSAARNFSVEKARHNWIFILDADEMIEKFDVDAIKKWMNDNPKGLGEIFVHNEVNNSGERVFLTEQVTRLYNRKYYHFDGIIHEQVIPIKNLNRSHYLEKVPIHVQHNGYLNEIVESKDKINRNQVLLEQALENKPKDPYLHYQLGKTHYLAKDYGKAAQSFETALSLTPDLSYKYVQDLTKNYGYALIFTEQLDKALELKKYEELYSKNPDFLFVLGLIYMYKGQFQNAIFTFGKCLLCQEGKQEGITSYLPNYNIGVIYESVGNIDLAIESYELAKTYEPAKKNSEQLILKAIDSASDDQIQERIEQWITEKKFNLARSVAQFLYTQKADTKWLNMLSVVEMMTEKYEVAQSYLITLLEKEPQNVDALFNLGYVYQRMNQFEKAIEKYQYILELTQDKGLIEDVNQQLQELKI